MESPLTSCTLCKHVSVANMLIRPKIKDYQSTITWKSLSYLMWERGGLYSNSCGGGGGEGEEGSIKLLTSFIQKCLAKITKSKNVHFYIFHFRCVLQLLRMSIWCEWLNSDRSSKTALMKSAQKVLIFSCFISNWNALNIRHDFPE